MGMKYYKFKWRDYIWVYGFESPQRVGELVYTTRPNVDLKNIVYINQKIILEEYKAIPSSEEEVALLKLGGVIQW